MRVFGALVGAICASSTLKQAQEFAGTRRLCGETHAQNGTINEEYELNENESCIYRVVGNSESEIKINALDFIGNCDDVQMFIFAEGMKFGPYCTDTKRRKRRGNSGAEDMMGQAFNSKEMDMVFMNGQRARFKFGFNFQFELLPGMPSGSGMCTVKNIKSSNAQFFSHSHAAEYPDAAVDAWNDLTDALYDFACYFKKYSSVCSGFEPAKVSCDLLNFSNCDACEMVSQMHKILKIISDPCQNAATNAWWSHWHAVDAAVGNCRGGTPAPAPTKPTPPPYTEPTPPPCDDDECLDAYDNDCDANASCTNKCKGYKCECNEGYEGDGKSCSKICDENQCASSYTNECDAHATCSNKCQGYECKCKKGYKGDGYTCTKICDADQCADGSAYCSEYATCTNHCEGFECVCMDGYSGDGHDCARICDANQCDDAYACGAHTTCTNKCTGYECKCTDEYYQPVEGSDPLECEPIDPCYGVKCGANMYCKRGECYCEKGYYPFNEDTCEEKTNECIEATHDCDIYANCFDTLAGYDCVCHDGYVGDGNTCVHNYEQNHGMCHLNEYSAFTDDKFAAIAFLTAPDGNHQEAIKYWNTLTSQLTQLGEISLDRIAECDKSAGEISCALIDYSRDTNACEWVATLTAIVDAVSESCNDEWKNEYILILDYLRMYACGGKCGEEPYPDCPPEPEGPCDNVVCAEYAHCEERYSKALKKKVGLCFCDEGYWGNGKRCDADRNKCNDGSHNCNAYAFCEPKDNDGYTCHCWENYYGNGYNCKKKRNECADGGHNCDPYAICTDLDIGWECECDESKGWYGDGRRGTCKTMINECETGAHNCHENADCTDTKSHYTCACKEGYLGDGRNCWLPLTCPWLAQYALDNYAGYAGDWPGVTELSNSCSLKYTKICTSTLLVDLIKYDPDLVCKKNEAVKLFSLWVNEMFALGKLFDKKGEKANSHAILNPLYHQRSYNNAGLTCQLEYLAVPCNLINFHGITTPRDLYLRIELLTYHIFKGCRTDYINKWSAFLIKLKSALICPVDECAEGSDTCHMYANCYDLPDMYRCVCGAGYAGDGVHVCNCIDYCDANRVPVCDARATCNNLCDGDGGHGYECVCDDGLEGDGNPGHCRPPNPCEDGANGGCDEYADCIATYNAYNWDKECVCHEGYMGNGLHCIPIDPCAANTCSEYATCTNDKIITSVNDYTCKCNSGYGGDGTVCVKIHPCEVNDCDEYADCFADDLVWTENDYHCVCHDGYEGDGHTCHVTDPCDNNECSHYATCTAFDDGTYSCKCNEPYEGDGMDCSLPDPCDYCDVYADCNNPEDNYAQSVDICTCQKGYYGDGFNCVIPPKCPYCSSVAHCSYETNGLCQCKSAGYWYNWTTKKCLDINECAVQVGKPPKNNCHENADCKNKPGGYSCTCRAGFKGDGVTCIKDGNGSGGYADGNIYTNGEPVYNGPTPVQGDFANPDGVNLGDYAKLADGTCSLMGYMWENKEVMLKKLKWSDTKVNDMKTVDALLTEFQTLGRKALMRAGPACQTGAGAVKCTLLFMPHVGEHRCVNMKRLQILYDAVATQCNKPWKDKWGTMVRKLVLNNSKDRGQPCPSIQNYLP